MNIFNQEINISKSINHNQKQELSRLITDDPLPSLPPGGKELTPIWDWTHPFPLGGNKKEG
jgi:hypothetical protein